ncbi:MAG: GMC family oxidoreductase [Gammaproteobacteria bacterium]|nr:GMC family oxidoreductase [Gammaproteobacteria bacterium]
MTEFARTDASVVVVIGSGASGAVVANSLAQRSVDVVCLEAGRRLSFADMSNNEAEMFGKFTWLDRRIGTGDTLANFPVWNCKTVGGTTMHWTGTSLRLQPHEMKARSTYGDIPGANLADWPLTYDELAPYYDQAEDRMGVTGTHGIERLPGNNNYKVFEAGAKKLGYQEINTNNVAINSAARDGRPGCIQLGFCISGCKIGAKWSTAYTEIPAAEATEHFELRTECMAVEIRHDATGKVSGVAYLDQDGMLREQKARAVCVGGNVVETSRLLLNSRSKKFPDGLANSSGMVGRNYMRHVLAGAVGLMPGPVNLHRGTHQAGVVTDDRGNDRSRGFVGGILYLTVPFTPDVFGKILMPGAWGERLTSVMEKYDHLAAMLVHGEDMAQTSNRITLHPSETDQYGLPVPVIHYDEHPNSRKLMRHALDRAREMYEAVGATGVFDMIDVFPATHNMGTARMGRNPKTSVCNAFGQTHDIENLFVSDGSLFPSVGCENPTLTIVALALRQADYVYEQLTSGAI